METLTIGKLAAKGGVGVETVRYYQRRGLLTEPSRDEGIRRYGDEDVRRLRFIRSAQTAGFTLEEIGELLGLDAVDDRTRARHLAEARIAAIDAKIAEMQSARPRWPNLRANAQTRPLARVRSSLHLSREPELYPDIS
jgi:MerR family mercuric resistance operon transcriptional regulator